MVIHKDDADKQLDDTVCVQVSLVKGEIGKTWSIAKTLKHVEVFNNIGEERIKNSKALLTKYFTSEQLSDILKLLLYPTKEVIDELVQIPQRLRNFKPNR